MKKADLIDAMAAVLDNKAQAEAALSSLLGQIETALKNDQSVSLPGLGTFKVTARNARDGINPKTGEKIAIPARKVAKFTPAKALKEAIN